MNLACSRCAKRLSRKTARMIDGKVMCSACMFGPSPLERAKASYRPMQCLDEMLCIERERRDRDGSGEAGETRRGSTEGNSPAPKGVAQTQFGGSSWPRIENLANRT